MTFRNEFYGQALTGKYKDLTVKVEMKYRLTSWFSDYHFCFH